MPTSSEAIAHQITAEPDRRTLRVYVVCTANICRSPMGMGILQERIAAAGFGKRVEVVSRGVQAIEGYGAAPMSTLLMAERGIDLSRHLSAPLTTRDVESAALILVMEERQRQMIMRLWPRASKRVLLWRELEGEAMDVPDPYAFGRPQYETTLALLERALDAGWPALCDRLGLLVEPGAASA
ncbi:MAG: low molecular weight phosphotyrosine protein phosphatase [Caldilineaceae bacterium]